MLILSFLPFRLPTFVPKIAPALIAAFAATSSPRSACAASPVAAATAPFHGLRTTKKVYEGQEEYRKHSYLQAGGATSEQWQQVNTIARVCVVAALQCIDVFDAD